MIMLVVLAVVAVVTFVWLLMATRTFNFQAMHETGFWANVLRVRLALAGLLWMAGCLVSIVGMLVFYGVIPVSRTFGNIALFLALFILMGGVPALLLRSATLVKKHLR